MKVAIATSSRSDFGLIRPIIKQLYLNQISVELVCLGAACNLQDEYMRDGIGDFSIQRISSPNNARSMKSMHQTVEVFSDLCVGTSRLINALAEPLDWFLVPGDRFEVLAATVAAYYSNVPIAHIFGGDKSEGGHLDDSVRHAITKLSHVHFAVCEDSHKRILSLGEELWRVYDVGSPMVETVMELAKGVNFSLEMLIKPRKYNFLCTYHPITTEPEEAGQQFKSLIEAFNLLKSELDFSCIFTYPNNECGSEQIIEELSQLKELDGYYVFESLGWKKYLMAMKNVDLVIGNSSSALLEAPILGIPALDIGTRQRGRFSPSTVAHVEDYKPEEIAVCIKRMLTEPKKQNCHPYGVGDTSSRVCKILSDVLIEKSKKEILQKKITY